MGTEMDIIDFIRLHHTLPESAELQRQIYLILIPLIAITVIILNSAVVVSSGVILHTGQQPRSTYIFLGNVALSDLLMGLALLYGHYYPKKYRNEYSCAVQIGAVSASALVSVFSVCLIAIDRYLYIIDGLRYNQLIYPTRARIMISLAWILGIIVGFLPAMGWRGDTDNGRICWFTVLAPPELVILTTTMGIIPLIINLVLYSIILYYALNQVVQIKHAQLNNGVMNTINGEQNNDGLRVFSGRSTEVLENTTQENTTHLSATIEIEQPVKKSTCTGKLSNIYKRNVKKRKNGSVPSKWKAIKVVLLTTGCFFFTWTPYFVASTWFCLCNMEKTPTLCNNLRLAISSPLAILGLCNSILNPFIYAWWHNGFRQSVKKIYYQFRQKCSLSKTVKRTSNEHNSSPSTSSTLIELEQPIATDISIHHAYDNNVFKLDESNESSIVLNPSNLDDESAAIR